VLVVQPSLQPPGGGNAPAAWIVQALKDVHEVSVLTWVPVDVASMNAYYGTSIAAGDITLVPMPGALRHWLEAQPMAAVLLKASLLFRHAKRIAAAYDVVVCGHNEADFGPRSVQYVHYPARLRPRPAVDVRWFHFSVVLKAYYALCERAAQLSPTEVPRALTLANSTWTAALAERLYQPERPVRVVYPPVAVSSPGRQWAERTNGFLCIGRLSPEKEIERVIRIVARVRGQVSDAQLHVIGSRGGSAYLARLRRLAASNHDWLHLHEDLTRTELLAHVATQRYYLHGMRDEHFGIAPAEAAAGGCVVFVPNGGGQTDIVGAETRLVYATEDEAVAKIVAVMTSPGLQEELRTRLAARASLFTTEHFMTAIRGVVREVASAR
jgi:glycosyltransferase involved in cell wall biosynthesis